MQFCFPVFVAGEQFSDLVETELLGQAIFLLIIKLFCTFILNSKDLVNTALKLDHDIRLDLALLVSLINGLAPHKCESFVPVSSQVVLLLGLPDMFVLLDRVQHKAALLVAERSVLAEGVEADNELFFGRDERLYFLHGEFFVFFLPGLAVPEGLLFAVLKVFHIERLFLIDGLIGGRNALEIFNSSIESLVSQAVLIN